MGTPYYPNKQMLKYNGVAVYSSNYQLYEDITPGNGVT